MALPKLSTAALNIYAAPPSDSVISPTTLPAASSKPEDSDPNYTLNYEEPENSEEAEAPAEKHSSVYYSNCTEAWNAGAAPIYRGEPGYRIDLDRDKDGIACEKRPSRRH